MMGLLIKYNVENINPPQLQRHLDKVVVIEKVIYEESKPYQIDVTDFQTGEQMQIHSKQSQILRDRREENERGILKK